jgi:hypothetical protein
MSRKVLISKILFLPLFIVLFILLFKGCELPTEIEESFPPTVPAPVGPANGSSFQNLTPTLTIRNSIDYRGTQVTYTFEVYANERLSTLVVESRDIPAGPEQTRWIVSPALEAGVTYYWRARGYNGTTYSEYSPVSSFTAYSPCISWGSEASPWGKAIIDSYIGCTDWDNLFTNPTEALGPPNAWRVDQSIRLLGGIVSLGLKGYIVVDMGVCIFNGEGPDLRVYQFVAHEPLQVFVSPTADGPWADLGVVWCWDPYCEFDLEGCIYEAVRYVKIVDQDPVGECVGPSRLTPGADIDAVKALNYY